MSNHRATFKEATNIMAALGTISSINEEDSAAAKLALPMARAAAYAADELRRHPMATVVDGLCADLLHAAVAYLGEISEAGSTDLGGINVNERSGLVDFARETLRRMHRASEHNSDTIASISSLSFAAGLSTADKDGFYSLTEAGRKAVGLKAGE